jgi:hypothetical protein
MKKTLLEITQDILNDLDSDIVNSIDDTVESQQVANIIRACYNEMISNRNWPHLKKLLQLDSLGDTDKPNYLMVPEGLKELITFSYDKRTVENNKTTIKEVCYKQPEDFLRYVSSRNADNDNVIEVEDFSGSTLLITNNQPPMYWTSFDDTYIVTDSYDVDVDSTLQNSKTQCLAYVEPVWEHTDEFVPNLPAEAFAALIEEAKSTAFITLKQMVNTKAEQKSVRQNRWLSRKAWRTAGGVQYSDFGRKGRR